MAGQEDWVDVGSVEELARTPLKSCKAQAIPIAISFKDGQFGESSAGLPITRRCNGRASSGLCSARRFTTPQ